MEIYRGDFGLDFVCRGYRWQRKEGINIRCVYYVWEVGWGGVWMGCVVNCLVVCGGYRRQSGETQELLKAKLKLGQHSKVTSVEKSSLLPVIT